ncbi:division plane positioning ATPase MipZ [Candidatus Cytomitobacter indipagum]|nr:division plane positioning ATPase MipZ [Candidatus Cytomitobacter indipagum]
MNSKIIAVSNIKGGTGKSTICANLAVALSANSKVLTIDIDKPQFTLNNYFRHKENPKFDHIKLEDENQLEQIIEDNKKYDYIIIDTPGSLNNAMKKACELADIFLTPISDSRFDLDVIGQFSPEDKKFTPGCYANIIWDARKHKLIKRKEQLKWIIVPNKLSVRITNNQRKIMILLKKMQSSLGFSLCSGVKDRVVFKELFNEGKTVFDLPPSKLNISNISAKNEIRSIIFHINNLNKD